MKLDLNEIEARLKAKKLQRYYGCNSTYAAKIVRRNSIPKELRNTPLYEVTNFLEKGIEVDTSLQLEDRYCFGSYLRCNKGCRTFHHLVDVYVNHGNLLNENLNNYLWMSKEQLEEHINYLRTDLGFDFFFRIIDEDDWYVVQYDFKNMSKLKIKYTLFWTRYSYEFPSSVCMIDTYLLKERYPEEELHNLLRIPQRFTFSTSHCIRLDQSISPYGLFIDRDLLETKLSRSNLSVCGIYETAEQNTSCYGHNGNPFGWIRRDLINLTNHANYIKFENWLRNDERFDVYDKMLKWYKEHPLRQNKYKG